MSRIFLISGPIKSGKTTRIADWIGHKNNVNGILQPVIDGRRYLREISSGEIRLLEIQAGSNERNIISVGKYKFNKDVFNWAQAQLLSAFYNNPEWLIIDEFGKLEIDGKGLEPAISKIINDLNKCPDTKIVFVIRDYIVSGFLNKYGLTIDDIKNLEM
jgi:nucleoside-triphosphatase